MRRTDSVNNNDDDIGPDMLTRARIAHSSSPSSPSLASTHHQSLEAPLLVFEPRFGLPLACRLSSAPGQKQGQARSNCNTHNSGDVETWVSSPVRLALVLAYGRAPALWPNYFEPRRHAKPFEFMTFDRLLCDTCGRTSTRCRCQWRWPLCGLQPKFKYFDCIYDT